MDTNRRLEHIERVLEEVVEQLRSQNLTSPACSQHVPEPSRADGNAGKKEAAAFLGISVRNLEARLYAGELASRRIGARRLIPWAELRKFSRRDHAGIAAPEAGK